MVASRRWLLGLAAASGIAGVAGWVHGPGSDAAPPSTLGPRPAVLLSAGTTRFIRAGVFQLPALGLGDRNASLAALALPASLPSSYRLDPSPEPDPYVEAEPDIPGDPLRDELKANAAEFPVPERSGKADLRLSRLPPGLEPSRPDDEIYSEADPFLPDGGVPPLARLSRQLEPPATAAGVALFKETRVDAALASALAERMGKQRQEPGAEEGAVPIDHSLAPVGGTSPAASRPDLASLDA